MVIPVEGTDDQFLVGLGRKLIVVTWDGVSDKVSKIEELLEVENEPGYTNNRWNDGKADPTGRLWAGNSRITLILVNCEKSLLLLVYYLLTAI